MVIFGNNINYKLVKAHHIIHPVMILPNYLKLILRNLGYLPVEVDDLLTLRRIQ